MSVEEVIKACRDYEWISDVVLPENASVKYDGSEKLGAMGLGFLVAGPLGAGIGALLTSGSKEKWVKLRVLVEPEGLVLGSLFFPWSEFRGAERAPFKEGVNSKCCLFLKDGGVIKFYSVGQVTVDAFNELIHKQN